MTAKDISHHHNHHQLRQQQREFNENKNNNNNSNSNHCDGKESIRIDIPKSTECISSSISGSGSGSDTQEQQQQEQQRLRKKAKIGIDTTTTTNTTTTTTSETSMTTEDTNEEEIDPVDDYRQRGNYEFQQGNLHAALSLYSAGMEILETQRSGTKCIEQTIVMLCNRSACYYQMLEYEQSLEDAQQAFALSLQSNLKAAYRLAKTHLALKEPHKAIQVLESPNLMQIMQQHEKEKEESNDNDDNEKEKKKQMETQIKALKTLKQQALEQMGKQNEEDDERLKETTIKTVNRPLSIREFEKNTTTGSLGVGNFSEIVTCTHKITKEKFALKILEKKAADDLAKRQHPNVYNEIAMEARVLLERIPPHPYIVQMYHSFQDYTCIYYLMDLHKTNNDLWTNLRYNGKMVGTHQSQVKIWMAQLVDAIEHIHRHGIVHRDLKPENILLNEKNHVVVIDFGTAKDMIKTDLNGPEFVGTPDFMSPEAVTGVSSVKPKRRKKKDKNKKNDDDDEDDEKEEEEKEDERKGTQANHCADLWALGATMYILLTGSTPFWSPSPYLTFLRIQRGLLPRLNAIWDDDAWDLITKLMQVDPQKRLGASVPWLDPKAGKETKNYDCLRQHKYFQSIPSEKAKDQHVIPSLQDLCIRVCADKIQKDALNLDLCDKHPPGDGSSHDLTKLSMDQQQAILHILEKSKVFKGGDETRVFQRFCKTPVDYIKAKVTMLGKDKNATRKEFLGLTRMTDDEFKIPSHRGSEDPYATKDKLLGPKSTIAVITNPLLLSSSSEFTPEQEKLYIQQWKQCIATINKKRPKAVIVCGAPKKDNTDSGDSSDGGGIPKKCWKFLARIRDSIPVIWNDGTVHYTFWLNGFQGIVLQSSDFIGKNPKTIQEIENTSQMKWIREQMEQSRMAKHQLYCFVDCDPRELPSLVLKRLARGRVLALFGLSSNNEMIDYRLTYQPNDTASASNDDSNNDNDDTVSVKSNDSVEDDGDRSSMRILGTSQNALRWIHIDEKEDWNTTLEVLE